MLSQYMKPVVARCAFAVGAAASTAFGQGAVFVGDLDSIDRAVLQQAAYPAQAKYPPGVAPAGVAPASAPQATARPSIKPTDDDQSFLAKLKPTWLFGDKAATPPADPFAAAASRARENAVRAGAQPIATQAPAGDQGVTTAAYNSAQQGGPALRQTSQRRGGLLSGLWSGGSEAPTQQPTRSGSYNQWSQAAASQPASDDSAGAVRSKLRPGGRPSASTTPATQTASLPRPSQRLAAPARIAQATPQPTRQAAPKRFEEPVGDVVMISDTDLPTGPTLASAVPKPAPQKKANPFVTAVSEPMPVAQADEPKTVNNPSVVAKVTPLTKVVSTEPELEELPPYPTAPEPDAGQVVVLESPEASEPLTVAGPPVEAQQDSDLAVAVASGPVSTPRATGAPTQPRSSYASAPRPGESTRFAHGPAGDLAPLVEEARSSEPTERSRTLLYEAHQIASTAATQDEFSAVIKRCRYVLAIDDSPLAKQYANSLAGWALTKRGDLLDEEGRYAESQTDYQDALRCDPECWRAEHSLGVAAAREGDMVAARVRFDRTIDLNPEYAKAYSNRAALAVQEGDFVAALADYGRAIEVDPDLAVAHNGRGRVCHMLGRLDEGLRHLDAAELLSPEDAMVATGRADLLVDLGNYGQALSAYKRAIEIDPQAPSAYRNLAWMLATCPVESFRNGAAAVQYAEHAEQLTSGLDDLLLDTKAAALAAAGRFDEAAETLRKAIDLAPESDALAYRERLALYEQGEAFTSQPAAVRQASYSTGSTR